jgi:hypothetical protein
MDLGTTIFMRCEVRGGVVMFCAIEEEEQQQQQ